MYCHRCERNVPDILWQGNDHPVLTNHNMVMNTEDVIENNTVKVTVKIFVEKRMCSEVFRVVPIDLRKE